MFIWKEPKAVYGRNQKLYRGKETKAVYKEGTKSCIEGRKQKLFIWKEPIAVYREGNKEPKTV